MAGLKQKFVIFGATRSGSTALVSALHSHPDVMCYGHPFFPGVRKGKRFQKLPRKAQRHDDYLAQPVDYVNGVLEHSNARCVGFKIWPLPETPQTNAAVDALIEDRSVHKVALHGSNELACFASRQLVFAARKNPKDFTEGGPRPKIPFPKQVFLRFIEARAPWSDRRRTLPSSDVLHIEYEGLLTTGLPRVAAMLGLEGAAFQAKAKKRNGNDILGRFVQEDHAKILETLAKLGHPEWVREDG